MGGEDERPRERAQQASVERLDGEPLEVHDVHAAPPSGPRRREHVGRVAGELRRDAGAARRRNAAIEALVDRIALRPRHRAVDERARDEPHVRPRPGQRGAQGVVVGRRVGGGIDDVDAHGG